MQLSEKQKWDEYYQSVGEEDSPGVAELGQEFLAWVEELLPPNQRKVLEAGCGSGAQSLAFARTARFETHLLDSSEVALNVARSLFDRHQVQAHFHLGDIFEYGPPEFDLVFNAGVIEHYSFEDQVKMVRAMAARSRGLIAVLAPNARCYWYWISRIRNAAAGAWPFGAERPVTNLREVYAAAGVRIVSEKFLGRAWTSSFVRNLPEIDDVLKTTLEACHASSLIADDQACYLYGAIAAVDSPPQWVPRQPTAVFEGDSLRALAADALSVRISAEAEIVRLRQQILELTSRTTTIQDRLNGQLATSESLQTELTGLKSELTELKNQLLQTGRERDSLAAAKAELAQALTQAIRESESKAADLAAAERTLSEARTKLGNFKAGVHHFQMQFESALSVYSSQRAWHIMLVLRKTYDLWMRQGFAGKLRAFPFLLTAIAQKAGSLEDQSALRFPSVEHFLPALALDPAEKASDLSVRVVAAHDCKTPLQRKFDVVVLAIIDFDFRFQRPQQIAAQYARNGHRVFWISPTRFVSPATGIPYHIREIRDDIWEIHLRGQQPDIYLGELHPAMRESMESSLRQLYRDWAVSENVVLIQLPFWRKLALSLRQEHDALLVYDCMDEWDSFENMGEFNRQEEFPLVEECDVLLVTAQKLADKFTDRGLAPVLVRNAVDYDFFASTPAIDVLPLMSKPVVGYFGAIADWIDLDLISQVAQLRPAYSFVLVGQVFGRDTSNLKALPNVHLLGNQPYERIPSYLHCFDVCQIPFLLNAVTAATDPVKLYEYLSLGKPVVATDMTELRSLNDLVYLAGSAREFAAKIDQALSEDNQQLHATRVEFARQNTWRKRVESIDSNIRERYPLVSIVIVTYNSSRYIRPCLNSIWRNTSYPNFELVVIDNNSNDGTVEMLSSHPTNNIRYETLTTNGGFASANNHGVRISQGDYIVFLNADTIVTPGWLGRLVTHLRADPSIGIVCPVTNFAGNEAKINTAYSDEASMERFAVWLASEVRGARTDIRMVPLFCAIVARSLFMELGGLDERYGIGMFEDDDLSAAIRNRGLRASMAEDCFVHHFGQGSFSKLTREEYNALFERNQTLFERKWNSAWQKHKLRPGVLSPNDDVRFQPEQFCRPLQHTGTVSRKA